MPGLPAGSYQPISLSVVDAGREKASTHFWGKPITAANHDAQVALFVTYEAAQQALQLGARVRTVYATEQIFAWTLPTNGAAREIALQVIAEDSTTGQSWLINIPTVDPTIPVYIDNVGARDAILMTEPTAITDFIDAFEALAVNPETPTHNLVVTGLKVVRGQK